MATKKQKREAAIAKREEFLTRERERGLEAQRLDREKLRLTSARSTPGKFTV